MRKKKSEMTPIELVDQALKGRTWEEAEEAGVEILARCIALHIYARKADITYLNELMERLIKRADAWAHEGNNASVLAMAACAANLKL